MNLTSFISMILGLTAGVLTAIIFSKFQAISRDKETVVPKRLARPTLTGSQCVYFRFPKEANEISKQKTPAGLSAEAVNLDSRRDLFDPRLNSTFLYNKVKILCFVLLQKGHIGNYGKSAKATWTKHCNKVLFLSSVQNGDIGTIDIKLPGGKSDWPRSKLGLRYVYDHFLDSEFDWFLKTGHDSFPVLENLRYLLLMHQANIPNYIGHVFSGPKSGGSVFALSKQALALIGPALQDYVPAFGGVADDLEMEACLKAAGATSDYQGMDLDGVQRFRMIVPDHKLPMNTKGYTAWYWQYIRHPEKEGPECCSDYSISFHYISPNNMYLLEYMIYHMRPFGVGHYTCPANMDAVLTNIQAPAKVPALGQKDQLGKVAGNAQVKAGDTSKSQEVPADQLMQ